ncbi:hypothetical protein [Kitasatospora sp. NPDC059462]|uniref:hypothetical protein n=1 Tax=Kitasatospora sp. NPDC059462 TaxID=3346841 RepID=UPI003675C788
MTGRTPGQIRTTVPAVADCGTDPFAPPGAMARLSCRPYRDAGGSVSGVPGEAAPHRAPDAAAAGHPGPGALDDVRCH